MWRDLLIWGLLNIIFIAVGRQIWMWWYPDYSKILWIDRTKLNTASEVKDEQFDIFKDLVDPGLKIWGRLVRGRLILIGAIVMSFMAYNFFSGAINYSKNVMENHVDTSEIVYKIFTPNCEIMADNQGNFIRYASVQKHCNLSNSTIATAVERYHSKGAFTNYASKIIFTYALFFFWVTFVVSGSVSTDEMIYESPAIFKGTMVIWLVISLALFPLMFRDYPSSQEIDINGETISVSSAYFSISKEEYFIVSPTYVGRIGEQFSGNRMDWFNP